MRPLDEAQGLVFVEALQGDRVDLDLEPRGRRGVHACKDDAEIAPAGHLAKLERVERIQRDVDALDSAVDEFAGKAGELRAVGRQGHFIERSHGEMAGKPMEQRHHIAPDQRLAAGNANSPGAQADEGRAQPVELLETEHVALRQEIHVLGHAVDAPVVAPVGDRHPDIGDRAAKRVNKRLDGGRRVRVHQSSI